MNLRTTIVCWLGLSALCWSASPVLAAEPFAWHVVAVGDVMLGSDYPTAQLPADEGRELLTAAEPLLKAADLTLGNLEGTLGDGGQSSKGGCGRCFVFRSPPTMAQTLADAGFDLLSQANNHAHDFGQDGLQRTARALDAAGVAHTGPLGQPIARWTVRGRRGCMVAFAPNAGMHDLREIDAATRWITEARHTCDLVVVFFHGGAEGVDHQHTPRGTEHYLGEDRGDVRVFAHAAIEAGADLVVGQGPHVARGLELYRGHLIAYSLGNFMTYGGVNVSGPMGLAPLLEVTLDDQGRLLHGQIHSFQQRRLQPLTADPSDQAAKAIAALTDEDFHGGRLHFGQQGRFEPDSPSAMPIKNSVAKTDADGVNPAHPRVGSD